MYPRQVAETFSEALAKEIAELRTQRGLSMNQTAALAGLAVSFVSDLEKGKRRASVETLVKLACVFGTSPSAILNKCEQALDFSFPKDA